MRFIVAGDSMEPAYPAGSRLLVGKMVYKLRRPRAGDVVVMRDPRERRRLILKRIEKIEGDEYFMAGDNPGRSTDSRDFGPVNKKLIMGKIMFRYPKNKLEWSALLLAFLGLADASYLTYDHFAADVTLCTTIPGSCELVTGSQYSVVFGIPLALYGVFFYLTALILVVWYIWNNKPLILQYLRAWAAVGFAVSLFLIYLQAFVLKAYCLFCLGSALISTLLFVTTLVLVKRGNRVKLE